MNCENKKREENDCCICNILEVINVLQNKSEKLDNIPNSCDRPFLGCNQNNNFIVYNTRPITLYNRNNETFTFPYTLNDTPGTSDVLRVENVVGSCITIRVLAPNPDTANVLPYVATDSFATINCGCVCALRCLPDTFIDCI